MEWQAQQALQMCGLNWQYEYALPVQGGLDCSKVVHKFEFADGNLDGHFPQAGRAHRNLIVAIFDFQALCFGEIAMPFQIPEQDVRIQQQLQG